jgi:hypothetical protein
MPRYQPLHKDRGGIAVDTFYGVNTQQHASKLRRGELATSLNNTSRFGNLRKEHGWDVVNGADLTASGSRMTDDHAAFDGTNAASVTGVIPYKYTAAAGAGLAEARLAFCGPELYDDVGNASFDPSSATYQIHTWGSAPSGDLPCWAEWDGNLFLSIGRDTTSGVGNGIQVWDGSTLTAFTGAGNWAVTNINASWANTDIRPQFMAVNWGYLVCGGVYNATATNYTHSTIYAVDLNGTATDWLTNVLGAGGDKTGTPMNGMIAFGDHVLVFTRNGDIIRLSWLSDLNIEGVAVGGTIITDRDRRISYQNGCAAAHSLTIAGQRLLWIADDGIWMLENSESLVPVRISEKLDGPSGIWDGVTKASLSGAYGAYDQELRQVLFAVPYGGSTKNNKVIVAQLPEDEYQAGDYRSWDWSVRDRCAASMAYDPGTRTTIWGQSVASGLLCEDNIDQVQAGATVDTNEAATGVSYTSTTLTDTGKSGGSAWTADELIGMPVVVKYAGTGLADTTWIGDNTDNDLTWDTDMALSATPTANDEYRVGGIHWAAILNEEQFEDVMFFGTGYARIGTLNGNSTVQSEIYVNSEANPTTQSHTLAAPGVVPVAVPFAVGGTAETNEKIYVDKRTSVVALGFRDVGYTGTPRVIRIDLPTKRITRTRRR